MNTRLSMDARNLRERWLATRPEVVSSAEWAARCELAALYRLFGQWNWSDLLSTHITLRIPDERDHFLINPYGLLYGEITASNLVKVDQHGSVLGSSEYSINPAGFIIHSCIHQARADVDCVIHLHTRDSTAVATQRTGLLPATQHALVIWDQIAYHDFEGPVLDAAEQGRLVADLGEKRILMLRNHGVLTAGRTVAEAFVLMYRIERACRVQIAAQAGGDLYPLSESVIQNSINFARAIFNKGGFMADGEKEWEAMLRTLDMGGVKYAA